MLDFNSGLWPGKSFPAFPYWRQQDSGPCSVTWIQSLRRGGTERGNRFLKISCGALGVFSAVRAEPSALLLVTQPLHPWPQFAFKTSASFAFPNSVPALRQSPGAESVRIVLWTFDYERRYAENQTRISQPQAGLRHDSLYNHQQLFLCWLGLSLHGRRWREKD